MTEAAAEPAVVGDPLVVLAANCSVKDAAALKTSLCAFSNPGDAVTLDVSAVERVDTATMQLLCAFVRDRGGRNQGVTWRGESAALQDAVRLLGVGALLGLETKELPHDADSGRRRFSFDARHGGRTARNACRRCF